MVLLCFVTRSCRHIINWNIQLVINGAIVYLSMREPWKCIFVEGSVVGVGCAFEGH